MVGVTSIEVKESLNDLTQQLRQAETSSAKERLQVLYWLKQDNAPSISAIAKAVGKHRNTLQSWLSMYREGGVEAMLEIKKSPGGVRVIPQWAFIGFGEALTRESRIRKLWSGAKVVSRNTGHRSGVSCSLPNDPLSTQSKAKGRSSSKLGSDMEVVVRLKSLLVLHCSRG
jgi:transposase-like protein